MTGYGHSWHQSHDQATVLLLVPYDTLPEDVVVQLEQNYLIAGVRDQAPLIKGRTYGHIIPASSSWQLEPRPHHVQNHERSRTTSTASTISNASSYAVVSSDPDISSSFAASLASAAADELHQTHNNMQQAPYPHQTTPPITPVHSRSHSAAASRPTSPHLSSSWISSSSSHSLSRSASSAHLTPSRAGRLLTIYLDKKDAIIWPAIIVGPVPASISPPLPGPPGEERGEEERYNMDAVSLSVRGVECEEAGGDAFEYFVRAWHQTHAALPTLRLTTYLPPSSSLHLPIDSDPSPNDGTNAYYLNRLGGLPGLARLYLEAGLLYLEGVAGTYLPNTNLITNATTDESGEEAEKWRLERETARKLFDRARMLDPHADVPSLPPDSSPDLSASELRMPSPNSNPNLPTTTTATQTRRRKKPEQPTLSPLSSEKEKKGKEQYEEEDSTWYLYLPGLIGAGTALVVVGIVGAMSIGSWRKSQNS